MIRKYEASPCLHDEHVALDCTALLPELTVKPCLAFLVGALVEAKRLAHLLPTTAQGSALPLGFHVDSV